jgi:hypothetical protein
MLYNLSTCLGVAGWIMIASYCFCMARSTGASTDQPQRAPSADPPAPK